MRGARRTGAWRVAAAVAGAVVALSVVGLVVASASQLTVSSGALFLQNDSRCTNATIATTGFRSNGTGDWNRVRLVGVPAACAGLPIEFVVYRTQNNGNTTELATGSGAAAGGAVDITTDYYRSDRVAGVALLIGGWGVPTTWDTGGKVISLRAHINGKYVTATSTTLPLIASSTATTPGTHEQFDLTINNDGSVSLYAHANNRFVTVDGSNSQLYANSTTIIGTSQKFNLITNADGTIALKSLATGFQVCSEAAGDSPLIANRDWIREWEEFDLIID